jgi:hypothetical protein
MRYPVDNFTGIDYSNRVLTGLAPSKTVLGISVMSSFRFRICLKKLFVLTQLPELEAGTYEFDLPGIPVLPRQVVI